MQLIYNRSSLLSDVRVKDGRRQYLLLLLWNQVPESMVFLLLLRELSLVKEGCRPGLVGPKTYSVYRRKDRHGDRLVLPSSFDAPGQQCYNTPHSVVGPQPRGIRVSTECYSMKTEHFRRAPSEKIAM